MKARSVSLSVFVKPLPRRKKSMEGLDSDSTSAERSVTYTVARSVSHQKKVKEVLSPSSSKHDATTVPTIVKTKKLKRQTRNAAKRK